MSTRHYHITARVMDYDTGRFTYQRVSPDLPHEGAARRERFLIRCDLPSARIAES